MVTSATNFAALNKDIFLRYSPIFIPDMQTLSALWEGTCDYSVLKKLGSNYINTSGMTPHISSTSDEIGIQINSSSRFETNGGVLPCTITFTNFRYEKL